MPMASERHHDSTISLTAIHLTMHNLFKQFIIYIDFFLLVCFCSMLLLFSEDSR